MDFLVRLRFRIPHDIGDEEIAELLSDERVRGQELRRAGHIVRIWREPQDDPPNDYVILGNVGIWSASDRNHLTQLLSSLPLAIFAESEITELSPHPLEEA